MTTPPGLLSAREWQILALVAQGLQNKEIAGQMNISIHTVEKHLTHIYTKLFVGNRVGAAYWYWKNHSMRKEYGNP